VLVFGCLNGISCWFSCTYSFISNNKVLRWTYFVRLNAINLLPALGMFIMGTKETEWLELFEIFPLDASPYPLLLLEDALCFRN